MALFGPKPWINPLGKMSIFRLFERHVFIAQKGVSSFQNIVKDISWPKLLKKKKLKKWFFLDQNHWLTPLEKCYFSVFWTFCFYSVERNFFVLEYRKRHFPGLNCLKRKVGKMAIFGPKPWVNPLGKCQFFDFLDFFL